MRRQVKKTVSLPFPALNQPHDGQISGEERMLNRIKKLEEDMYIVRTDVAVIKASYATRADVSEAKQSIILWVVSAIFLVQLLPAFIHYFSP
ncbi:hypothetical protein ACVWZ0_002733 [Erwinia sp. TECH1]|jgi:hypothetical protein